jgi:hypothetical protein
MCIAQPKVIAAPKVAPPPTREQVTARAVNDTRSTITKRLGQLGNIRTTPLGDASYGNAAVARFA